LNTAVSNEFAQNKKIIPPTHGTTKKRKKGKYNLFLMVLPFLALCFVFSYLPLYGWIYSLFDWKPGSTLSQNDFVGLYWFKEFLFDAGERDTVIQVLQNTFAISGLNILTSVLPMLFAIFLTEVKTGWYRRIVQTLTTIPNFISWVLVYSFAFQLFKSDGLVNTLLQSFHLTNEAIQFLGDDTYVWLTMTLWGLWKGLGWSAIMYLAAISGIDQELYEAARVDGAGRFRMMWNITLPGILPTFFILLLLGIANFLNNGMDQYFVFQNALNQDKIQVLDLYVYNIGMGSGSYSMATAIGIIKSLVSLVLLLSVNGLSKVVRGQSII
jgi:ABC-type polysaccharide transport system, permease component